MHVSILILKKIEKKIIFGCGVDHNKNKFKMLKYKRKRSITNVIILLNILTNYMKNEEKKCVNCITKYIPTRLAVTQLLLNLSKKT